MANPWLLLIPLFGPMAYQQQAIAEVSAMIAEAERPKTLDDLLKSAIANAPILVGAAITGGTILGIAAMAKDAYQHRITEHWENQPPLPGYERQGRFRKYAKGWLRRHKKELKAIGGVGLLAGTVALVANSKPEPAQGTTGAMPGALWGGTPMTSGWSSILHGDR